MKITDMLPAISVIIVVASFHWTALGLKIGLCPASLTLQQLGCPSSSTEVSRFSLDCLGPKNRTASGVVFSQVMKPNLGAR